MNLKQNLLRTRVLVLRPWFLGTLLVIFLLIPTQVYARTTTYIGNYEVTVEDNGIKKETVRVAGTMGKVVKSRETGMSRAVEKTWNYSYYTTDQQGSTRQELSESVIASGTKQSIPKPNSYYAYGTPIPVTTSEASLRGTPKQSVLNAQTQKVEDTYTGQKKDEETNLMYYNARYYNPQTGLFIQSDSVDDGQNKYQYVASNPISNTDPSGNVGGSGAGQDCMCGGNRSGIYSDESVAFLKQAGKVYGTTVLVGATASAAVELGAPTAVSALESAMQYVAASPVVAWVATKAEKVINLVDKTTTIASCLGLIDREACSEALVMGGLPHITDFELTGVSRISELPVRGGGFDNYTSEVANEIATIYAGSSGLDYLDVMDLTNASLDGKFISDEAMIQISLEEMVLSASSGDGIMRGVCYHIACLQSAIFNRTATQLGVPATSRVVYITNESGDRVHALTEINDISLDGVYWDQGNVFNNLNHRRVSTGIEYTNAFGQFNPASDFQ